MDFETVYFIYDNEDIEALVTIDPEEVDDDELADLLREAQEVWPAIEALLSYVRERGEELDEEEE